MKRFNILLVGVCVAAGLLGQALIIGNGTKTVTTAGTAVRIVANNTIIKSGTIQALSSNTGTVCVGSSTVLASSKNGICLSAGQATPLFYVPGVPWDLSTLYIDSTVNSEGVSYTYAQ